MLFMRLQKQLIVSILTKRYCGSPSVILSIKKKYLKDRQLVSSCTKHVAC